MAYATQTDIEALYGTDALHIADRDNDGVADAAAVATALQRASGEIDTYLGVRYALPLAPESVSDTVVQMAVDIALYRLASTADLMSEEHRQRYEDAIAMLKRLANGQAVLPVSADTDGDGDLSDEFGGGAPRPIVQAGAERLFSRAKMRGL